jgi:hypothetical protein
MDDKLKAAGYASKKALLPLADGQGQTGGAFLVDGGASLVLQSDVEILPGA